MYLTDDFVKSAKNGEYLFPTLQQTKYRIRRLSYPLVLTGKLNRGAAHV